MDFGTFRDDILDWLALLSHPQSLILLAQFRQNQGSNRFEDAREHGVTVIEKPPTVGWCVKVYATF